MNKRQAKKKLRKELGLTEKDYKQFRKDPDKQLAEIVKEFMDINFFPEWLRGSNEKHNTD